MTKSNPSRGDVVIVDFDPQAGHEQAGKRPGLVVSDGRFNAVTGFVFVCPITNQAKGFPFEVAVSGAKKTTGVVLAHQVKSLDIKARNIVVVDHVSKSVVDDVVSLINKIITP